MQFIKDSLGNSQVTFFSIGPETYSIVGFALFLLLILAVISAVEMSFLSLTPSNLNTLKKRNSKASQNVLKILKDNKNLSGNVLAIKSLMLICILLFLIFPFHEINKTNPIGFFGKTGLFVSVFFIVALFCIIFPKKYGSKRALKVALFFSIPFGFLLWLSSPVNKIIHHISNTIRKNNNVQDKLSMNNLTEVINHSKTPSSEEKEILKGIVEFSSTEVNDILTSRVEMVALDIKSNYKKVIQLILESGYSRIPVYNSNIDNIKGILYIKDLLPHLQKPEFKWQVLIRPPYFIPEKKKINDLLQEFQTNKNHMAIVVDEYGGTKGIVCLEDILEEIVGEIRDEFDEEDKSYSKIDKNNFIFTGRTLIHDFYRITGANPDDFEGLRGESDTLAGFILEIKGRIPQRAETLKVKNYVFKIEEADNRSIKKIRFIISDENV